jgi:hypothetical protein
MGGRFINVHRAAGVVEGRAGVISVGLPNQRSAWLRRWEVPRRWLLVSAPRTALLIGAPWFI